MTQAPTMFSDFARTTYRTWEQVVKKTHKTLDIRSLDWCYDPYLPLKPYYDAGQRRPKDTFPERIRQVLLATPTKNLLYWRFSAHRGLSKLLPFCEGVIVEYTASTWSVKRLQEAMQHLSGHAPIVLRVGGADYHPLLRTLRTIGIIGGKTTHPLLPNIWLWRVQRRLNHSIKPSPIPGGRDLVIDACDVFHQGAPPTLQVAYLSARLTALFDDLLTTDSSPSQLLTLLSRIFLVVPVEEDYFHQIAKLRAIRWHVDRIVRACYARTTDELPPSEHLPIPILSITGLLNRSFLAAQMNMLRNTSATMACLLGGTEALATLPFDAQTCHADHAFFSHRTALHNVHILRHESDVALSPHDPVQGAHFLESLISDMALSAWKIFQQICGREGIQSPTARDYFRRELQASVRKKLRITREKYPLRVGINAFVEAEETTQLPASSSAASYVDTYASGRRNKRVFSAAPHEAIRQRSEHFFAEKNLSKPVLLLSLHRRASVEAVQNIFACLGVRGTTNEQTLRAYLSEAPPPVGWVWAVDKHDDAPPVALPSPLFLVSHTLVRRDVFFLSLDRRKCVQMAECVQKIMEDAIAKLL